MTYKKGFQLTSDYTGQVGATRGKRQRLVVAKDVHLTAVGLMSVELRHVCMNGECSTLS